MTAPHRLLQLRHEADAQIGTLCYVPRRHVEGRSFMSDQRDPETNVQQTRLQVLKPTEGGLYRGFWHAFSKVRTVEGGGRMWKGVSSVMIGAGICQKNICGDLGLTFIIKALHMRSISSRTRMSNTQWVEMNRVNIL